MECECHPIQLIQEKYYSVWELEQIIEVAKDTIEMLEVKDHE